MTNVIKPAITSYSTLQSAFPKNKKLGGLIGLITGDAVGCLYEFRQPSTLPARELIDIIPPEGFIRSFKGVPVGTYSDDAAQMLCLLVSLLKHRKVDLTDFSMRLCDWFKNGYLAVDGIVFDAGIQTVRALHAILKGADPMKSGGILESSNGNGSLMRVLPLALLHDDDDFSLVKEAHLQSMPTHGHPRSFVVCALYCLIVRAYLNDALSPWEQAEHQLASIYSTWPDPDERSIFLTELNYVMTSPYRTHPTGTGYVVDTIWTAKQAMKEKSYEEVIKTAIGFGFDTDTSSAVAGGLAGIKFGMEGIPTKWLAQLRGWDIVHPHIEQFCY